MHNQTAREMGFRAYHGFARATVNEVDDKPMMQTSSVDMYAQDSTKGVERIQNFGFASVPLPRDKIDGQQNQTAGGGYTSDKKGPAAEAIMGFIGGDRSHPVIFAIDDRRHRPRKMKPGESGQYDEQGQGSWIMRDGVYLTGTKKIASLRHSKAAEKDQGAKGGPSKDHAGKDDSVNSAFNASEKQADIQLGKNLFVVVKNDKVYLGGDPAAGGTFAKVMTENGPSANVFAKIS